MKIATAVNMDRIGGSEGCTPMVGGLHLYILSGTRCECAKLPISGGSSASFQLMTCIWSTACTATCVSGDDVI